jgi:hypothetical protein
MSSYLSFYARHKDVDSKPIHLVSYSRNNEIYQQFNDTIHPAYVGNSDECQYTVLTVEQVDSVIKEIESELRKARFRLEEYTKHASGNMDMVEYILEQKEYIEDLECTLYKTMFIRELVSDASYSWSKHEILCNID